MPDNSDEQEPDNEEEAETPETDDESTSSEASDEPTTPEVSEEQDNSEEQEPITPEEPSDSDEQSDEQINPEEQADDTDNPEEEEQPEPERPDETEQSEENDDNSDEPEENEEDEETITAFSSKFSASDISEEKWSFSVRYIGQDDYYDVTKTNNFTLKYQVNFHTDLPDLDVGKVEIRIPAAIYQNRYKEDVYASSFGIPEGTEDAPVVTRTSPFNYYLDEKTKEYVFWNYKTIPMGTTTAFQVLYGTQNLMDIIDCTEWKLTPKIKITYQVSETEETTEEATSTPLTGIIDSKINLRVVSKNAYSSPNGKSYTPGLYTQKQVERFISGSLPGKYQTNFDDYFYVVWNVSISGNANQPWSLIIEDVPTAISGSGLVPGEIVGYSNSSSTSSTIETGISYSESISRRYYVVTAYPNETLEIGMFMYNTISVTAIPADGIDSEQYGSDSARWAYQAYDWHYVGDIIGVYKYVSHTSGNGWTDGTLSSVAGWADAYRAAQKKGKDYNVAKFYTDTLYRGYSFTHTIDNTTSSLGNYIDNTYYTIVAGDDTVYGWDPNDENKQRYYMDSDDYYFSSVQFTVTDTGYDVYEDETTSATSNSEIDRDVYIYAMYAGSDEWTPVTAVQWSRSGQIAYEFTEEELAKQPWRVKAVHNSIDYSTEIRIYVTLCIRYNSPLMTSTLMHEKSEENYFTFENLSSVFGTAYVYDDATETYKTITVHDGLTKSGTNYGPYTPNPVGYSYSYDRDLKELSEIIYADEYEEAFARDGWKYPQRDNAVISTTPVQKRAEAFKFNTAVNDTVHGRVVVDYTIAAYEGYLISSSSDYSYLRANDDEIALPDRSVVEIYDLLPTGVIYDPTVAPVAGYIKGVGESSLNLYKKWNLSQTSVTAEYMENYNDTGRNLVKFIITYTGTDPSAYASNLWFQGFGVSFQAYTSWNDVQNSMEEKNVAAYIPTGSDIIGTDTQVAKDDGVAVSAKYSESIFMSDGISVFGSDINKDGIIDSRNVLYAASSFSDDYVISYTVGLYKLVKADDDVYNEPSDSALVDYNSGYTYSIVVTADNETQVSDITIFDQIENFEGNEWYGSFTGIDTSAAKNAGAEPVVYYHTDREKATMPNNDDEGTLSVENVLTAENGWYLLADCEDYSKVQAIAVQLKGLTLHSEESVEIQIHMTSPTLEELDYNTERKVTWNEPHMLATVTSENNLVSQEEETKFHNSTPVRVELYSSNTVEVIKEFSDIDAVPDSLKNESFQITLNLIRVINGKEASSVFSYQPYDLYERTGDSWSRIATDQYTDVDGIIYLKAGQKAVFYNITGGTYLRAEEEESIFWNSETTEEENVITITNTYRPILYLTKTVSAVPGDVDISDDVFTFHVSLYDQETDEYKPASGYTYWTVEKAYTNGIIPTKTGEGVLSADGTVTLKAGETIAIFSNYERQSFVIEEVSTGDNWICLENTVAGVLGTFGTITGITNYYKWKDLLLTKNITMQSEEEAMVTGEEFTFEVLDAEGNPLTTKNEWILLDSKGKETETKGNLNADGQFTVACAAQTVKIRNLEADQTYTIHEVDSGQYYIPIEDTATVTMPIYSTSKSIRLTNEWQKRDLRVNKMVVAEDTNYPDEEFTFTLYDPEDNPAGEVPYTIGDDEYLTAEDGTFILHADETAYFHNLDFKSKTWTIEEIQNDSYPQVYPLDSEPNVIELGDGENMARFVNGSTSVLMIQKTWNSGDIDSQALVEQINSSETKTIGDDNWDKSVDIQLIADNKTWPSKATSVTVLKSDGSTETKTWAAGSQFHLYPGETVMIKDLAGDTDYQVIESSDYTDMWLKDQTDIYHILATVSKVSGTPATVPAATLVNTVTKLDPAYFVTKLMTEDSSEVPTGAVLTLRALQDDGTPRSGLNYILMQMVKIYTSEYTCSSDYGSEFAITIGNFTLIPADDISSTEYGQSDEDGLIQITAVSGYTPVLFFDENIDTVHLVEVPELSDSEWGCFSYTTGDTVSGQWAFINSNVSALLNIYKKTTEEVSSNEDFVFELKQKNNDGYIPALNVDYTVYDAVTNQIIKTGNTGSAGTVTIKAGQYAQIETSKYTYWMIQERENANYTLVDIRASTLDDYVSSNDKTIELMIGDGTNNSTYTAVYTGNLEDIYAWNTLDPSDYLVQKFTTDEYGVTTVEQLSCEEYTLQYDTVPEMEEGENFAQIISITDSGDKVYVNHTLYPEPTAYAILYEDGTMVFQRGNTPDTETYGSVAKTYTGFETKEYTKVTSVPWYYKKELITNMVFKDRIHPISTRFWFYNYSGLTSLDLSGLVTSNLTDMSEMFRECSGLTSLDLSGFDTSRVTDMSDMFCFCSGLTSLDLSGFDTSRVTDMSLMFYGCSGLTSLDMSDWDWDTSSVTDMHQMFYNCSGLTSLDMSDWGWDTSSVTSMNSMFAGCFYLTSLNLSGFDTSNVTNMKEMFHNCTRLTSLDLSSFDTSNVTNMSSPFDSCRHLQQVTIGANDSAGIIRLLPTPSSNYITGADGNWYSSDGTAYAPSDIPLSTADTYYASKSLLPS